MDETYERTGDLPEFYGIALNRIRTIIEPVDIERIPIENAMGRIPARDLVAPFQVPSHPVSTRDGYALKASDTVEAGLHKIRQLQIAGSSFPDTEPATLQPLLPGEAMNIATGAPLPPGADAVLIIENAALGDATILVSSPIAIGTGVRFPGDDIRENSPIVLEGKPLGPSQMGLLCAAGLSQIEVYRVPTVAIISTGNEIATGHDDHSGMVPPSNAINLSAWCTRFNLGVKRYLTPDDPDRLDEVIDKALAECDAVVTIGGTGPGGRDLVFGALAKRKWRVYQHGVRLRPGRTSCFGLVQEKPVFLLPGPPTANETAFLMLALPGLLRLAGSNEPPFSLVPARLSRALPRSRRHKQWTQVIRVKLVFGTFFLQAIPLVGPRIRQRQGRLQAFADANGILLLEEDDHGPREGDIVSVIVIHSVWESLASEESE
jgi:molybdopterin molybdotransferase